MRTYSGERVGATLLVRVDGRQLCPRPDLIPHRPEGFHWGDRSAASAQLALAILADHFPSDENRALDHFERFRDAVIARLPPERWTLTSETVDAALALIAAPDPIAA